MRSVLLLALVLVACGTSTAPPTGDSFLAFTADFEGFRSWPSFHSDGPAPGTQPEEILGPRTEYINAVPGPGEAEFPIGTIVIEALEDGSGHLVAAVKRGGGYNAGRGWEWMEIKEEPLAIVWRGLGPPNGESYGGDREGCNTCHDACGAGNDLRCSPNFQLASF